MIKDSASVREWKDGWQLVLACFFGFSFFSVMSASMAVFMVPLGEEFRWSRTLLSSGVAIASGTTAVLSPFFGMLIDRFGSRRVAMPGLIASIVAISCFSFADGTSTQWLLLWAFYAVISISIKTTVWTTAVTGFFRTSQGLALGITLSGIAFAQTVVPPLASGLIASQGWRAAYIWLGCGWGGVTFVFCYLFLHDCGKKASERDALADAVPSKPNGLTPAQAWRNSALQRVAITTFLMVLLTIGLLVHQIEIMIAAGISQGEAAWVASLAGIAGIVGKLLTGALLDRYRTTWIGALTMAATAIGFIMLFDEWETTGLLVPAMIICGYSAGTALQIGSYYTAKYAGFRNFGTIYGVLTSIVALGSGLGPLAAGATYDLAGSYSPFLATGVIGSLVCGVLILTLPDYPDWATDNTSTRRDVAPGKEMA